MNTCLNFRAARRPIAEELPDALPDRRASAAERLEHEEQAQRVREAVSCLPEKQRATVILKIYHDLTHEEVAAIVGASVGTVKANLFHALGNLRSVTLPNGTLIEYVIDGRNRRVGKKVNGTLVKRWVYANAL